MNIIRYYIRGHQEIHLTHLVGYVTAKSSNEITYLYYRLFLYIEKRAGFNNNITDLLQTCITFLTAYPILLHKLL